jgi:hypothetical protein
MKPLINLNNCKAGDFLITGEGRRYTYIERTSDDSLWFPHEAKAANGDVYTFTNSGQLRNLPDEMQDVMEIVRKIDLNTCKVGDILVTKSGFHLRYNGRVKAVRYHHHAISLDGKCSYSFTDDGWYSYVKDDMCIVAIQTAKDKPAVEEKMYVVKYTSVNSPTFDVMAEGKEIDDFLKNHGHKVLGIWEFGQEMTLATKLVPKTV